MKKKKIHPLISAEMSRRGKMGVKKMQENLLKRSQELEKQGLLKVGR